MLAAGAVSEAAVSALPDSFTGAIEASATLVGTFDLVTNDPFVDFVADETTMFVYSVEITVQPISDSS